MTSIRPVHLALVTVLAVAAVSVGVAQVKTNAQFDETFNFSTIRTWTWHPDAPGDVLAMASKYDDADAIQKQVEPSILASVQDELVRKGYLKAETGEPDFYVTYYVLLTAGTSSQQVGQFLPGTVAWGLPPFAASTQSLEVYEQGSLVLDVTALSEKEVVWRGVAQARVDRSRSPADREKRLRNAVKDLLKQFPPKPKKR